MKPYRDTPSYSISAHMKTSISLVLEACDAALARKIAKDHPDVPKDYPSLPKVSARTLSRGCDIEVTGSDMKLGRVIGRYRQKGWRTEDHKRLTTQDPKELAEIFVGSLQRTPSGTFQSDGTNMPPFDDYRCWDLVEDSIISIFPSNLAGFHWILLFEGGQMIYLRKPLSTVAIPAYLDHCNHSAKGTWMSTLVPPMKVRSVKGYGQQILRTSR